MNEVLTLLIDLWNAIVSELFTALDYVGALQRWWIRWHYQHGWTFAKLYPITLTRPPDQHYTSRPYITECRNVTLLYIRNMTTIYSILEVNLKKSIMYLLFEHFWAEFRIFWITYTFKEQNISVSERTFLDIRNTIVEGMSTPYIAVYCYAKGVYNMTHVILLCHILKFSMTLTVQKAHDLTILNYLSIDPALKLFHHKL